MFKKLEKRSAELRKIKEESFATSKAELKRIIKGLFKKHPTLKLITWDQYTPYFNDGSPCVFGVHDVNYTTYNKKNKKFSKKNLTKYDFEETTRTIDEDIQKLDKFLHDNEDLAEFLFGEGTVTCAENIISVEDCDHD